MAAGHKGEVGSGALCAGRCRGLPGDGALCPVAGQALDISVLDAVVLLARVVTRFRLFWVSIAESYLAVKAMLDAWVKPPGRSIKHRFIPFLYNVLGALAAVLLLSAAWLYARWYAARGGYVL